jgi:hypothetical protein
MPHKPKAATVTVRMYRHGLGDCLLVTITPASGKALRMMIDCGVYLTTTGGKAKMRAVVTDIIAETDGYVDILVLTHEHGDHISGLNQAADLFWTPPKAGEAAAPTSGRLRVGQVWMGWTEDLDDPVASRIETEKRDAFEALDSAKRLAEGVAAQDEDAGQAQAFARGLGGVMDFFRIGDDGGFAAAGRSTRDAMNSARSLGEKPIRFARPTDKPFELAPGIRVYCFGPPMDATSLFTMMDEDEVYHADAPSFEALAYAGALAARMPGVDPAVSDDPGQPFDTPHRVALDFDVRSDSQPQNVGGEIDEFFERHYWGASADPGQPDQQWRRIDADWLAPAGALALKLDNATNNTSLVLAIELVESGKVLLFPGDAQVGSWLSWMDLSWKLPDGGTVTAPELLRRTAFLKVGHHGSHNATLKDKGLETMKAEGFVAFIPVDQEMARKVGWGEMPLAAILAALTRQTKGCWIRTDEDFTPGDNAETQAFAARLTQTELFYEIEISGANAGGEVP